MTSPTMAVTGLPVSIASSRPKSVARARNLCANDLIISERSSNVVPRHCGNAATAAATAASTSGGPRQETRAMVEPSCGAVISIAAPSAALTRSPPMSIRQSRSSSLATSVLLLSREDCTCYAHFLEDHSSA